MSNVLLVFFIWSDYLCSQITILITYWCINATCKYWASHGFILTEYILLFYYASILPPSCSLLTQTFLICWQKMSGSPFGHLHDSSVICFLLLCPLPDDFHLNHRTFFACLRLPTFTITLEGKHMSFFCFVQAVWKSLIMFLWRIEICVKVLV